MATEGAGAGAELLENAGEAHGWESRVGSLGDGPLGLGASGAFLERRVSRSNAQRK